MLIHYTTNSLLINRILTNLISLSKYQLQNDYELL